MRRGLFIVMLLFLLFGLGMPGLKAILADEEVKVEPINVGNKICPVSGEKIDEKTKATYEYEGKIYNFCCPACVEEFKKDPKKYIEKINEELETGSKKSEHEGHQIHME